MFHHSYRSKHLAQVNFSGPKEVVADLDNKASCLFFSQFWPLSNQTSLLEAAGAVV